MMAATAPTVIVNKAVNMTPSLTVMRNSIAFMSARTGGNDGIDFRLQAIDSALQPVFRFAQIGLSGCF